MPKITRKRVLLMFVAVWLVGLLYSLMTRIPVAEIWHGISSPSTSSIVERLQSSDPAIRRLALKDVDYKNRHHIDVMQALTHIALDDSDPQMQSGAIGNLAGVQVTHGTDGHATPSLPQQSIDDIADLVLGDYDKQIRNTLMVFLMNSARWQTRHQQYIQRLTHKLAAAQDKSDTERLLQALTAYARLYPLPAETFSEVLKIYNTDRLQWGYTVREASKVFYGAAYTSHFPEDVQTSIEHALRHHDNRDIRLNAVYTLGNQSRFTGQLSPALHDALKDDDKDIRDKAGWSITQFRQHQGEQQGDSLWFFDDHYADFVGQPLI